MHYFCICFISTVSFAQRGRLEQLRHADSVYVLRTPKESLKKLNDSPNKTDRRIGDYITSISSDWKSQGRLSYQPYAGY